MVCFLCSNSKLTKKKGYRIGPFFNFYIELSPDNSDTELRLAIEEIRRKTENKTKNIEIVFQYLDELLIKKDDLTQRQQIGYKTSDADRS